MIIKWFQLFYERRIAVPLGSNGLMLDVGCGDKPHWRADVLVDRFIDAAHAKQRNLGGAIRALEPLFEAPLENLPFRDKVFDYVYCSHVLEHVDDPAAAVSELMRVGTHGYIEVPFVGIQKIYDQETHLWFCRRRGNELVFVAKEKAIYDEDIAEFLDQGPLVPFAFLMNLYPDAAMIRLRWSERTPVIVKVIGEANSSLSHIEDLSKNVSRKRNIWPYLRRLVRCIGFRKLRRKPVSFNDIVKTEYKRDPNEILMPGVYRVATQSRSTEAKEG